MGDIKRKDNIYSWPRKLFDKKRIDEEKELVKKYGLKNKREIWKGEFRIKEIRKIAKSFINKEEKEREKFLKKIKEMGFNINSIEDVLALTKEDWLDRRLQTIVFKKGLAKTIKEARQLITHKKVFIGEKMINKPSHFVTSKEESLIRLKEAKNG